MQTFSWYPDVGSQQDCKPNVAATKFGDGYESRAAIGINSAAMKWTVKFDRAAPESKQVLAFLRARGGVEAFNWTNPLNEPGKYVCREWRTEQQAHGIMVVSCTFDQVFEV